MTIPSFSLAGKVALITGGRRGIGKTIALAFTEAGADIALCDIVTETGELKDTAEEISQLGRRSLDIRADVRVRADVENMVKQIMAEFGHIDILVNNAGNLIIKPFLEVTDDEWDSIIDTHLKGNYLCSQTVGKIMVEQKAGNIISMSSAAGLRAVDEQSVYGAAKAGITMLTKVLAREFGPYNIRVNAIAPTMLKTKIIEPYVSDEEFEERASRIPLGRMPKVEEVASIALFLASDASSWINGHTILADGGLWA